MLRTVLREPLVHFLGIGLLLFALYALVAPSDSGGDEIVISRAMIEDIEAQHRKLWGRAPTDAERKDLIDNRIADEILYREGLAMGLDRDDAVVKRRVRQNYELIAEEEDSVAPTEADLEAYLKANVERFRAPPIVGFQQILVPIDGSNDTVQAQIAALKKALDGGADPAARGLPTLLPARVDGMRLDLVARDFGGRFADALATLPVGSWQGPILSGYGVHLVRIDTRTPAADPVLDSVRADVLREWDNARRKQARAERLAMLRKRYTIVVEDAGEAAGAP